MTKTTAIIVDSRGIARGAYSHERAIASQEAAVRAISMKVDQTEVDHAEIARCEKRAADLKQRARERGRVRVDPVPAWLIAALGGPQDAISVMLRSHILTDRQGMSALSLRLYESKDAAGMQSAELRERVQGNQASGMLALILRLDNGFQAKQAAIASLPHPRFARPVHAIVMGWCGVDRASRNISGKTETMAKTLQSITRTYLDTAAGYFTGFA